MLKLILLLFLDGNTNLPDLFPLKFLNLLQKIQSLIHLASIPLEQPAQPILIDIVRPKCPSTMGIELLIG